MAEIVFTEISELKKKIDAVYINQEGEEASAHRCLLIKQSEPGVTLFTAYKPYEVKHAIKVIHGEESGGQKDTQFLVDHASLREELEKFKPYRSVTFRADHGAMAIAAEEEQTEDGLVCEGRSIVRQYTGETSDFSPQASLGEEHLVCSIKERDFKEWIETIGKFGGVDPSSQDSFYIQLIPQANLAMGISHYAKSYSGYMFTTQTTQSIKQEETFSVYNRDITRLKWISGRSQEEEVDIYYDKENNWLEFRGVYGTMMTRSSEANQQIVLARSTFKDCSNQKGLQPVCKKLFSLEDLIRKLESSKVPSDQLSLETIDDVLVIMEAGYLSDKKYFNCYLEPGSDVEEWMSCNVQGRMLTTLLITLSALVKERGSECQRVWVEQFVHKEKENLVILLVTAEDEDLEYAFRGLVYAKKADLERDKAEVDD